MAVVMKKLDARECLPDKDSTMGKQLHRKPGYTTRLFSPGIVNWEQRHIVMATVGTPHAHQLTFPDLCHVIADVLTSLKSYGSDSDIESHEPIMRRDISISNIIVLVHKGDVILLDNDCFVRARHDTW